MNLFADPPKTNQPMPAPATTIPAKMKILSTSRIRPTLNSRNARNATTTVRYAVTRVHIRDANLKPVRQSRNHCRRSGKQSGSVRRAPDPEPDKQAYSPPPTDRRYRADCQTCEREDCP